MNLSKFLPVTETTFYILLALQQPLHGYSIMQRVTELSSGKVSLAAGTLYSALDNLKKNRLIEPDKSLCESRRKVYRLTEHGHELLKIEFARLQELVNISIAVINGEK